MKIYSAFFYLLLVSLPMVSGCAVFAVSAGAAAGYGISSDEIEGYTDKTYDETWQSIRKVLTFESAVINTEDRLEGLIKAELGGSDIKVQAKQVSTKVIRIRIEARRFYRLFPNIKLSQSLFAKVLEDLNS